MSGLRKAKKYDWKDSNLSLFGSDLEKNVKKASAEGEPAWEGAGTKVGLQIWRIVKFKVTHWPKEDYGKFFSGDSYIILHTYKKDPDSEELSYDVHFWIGKQSSQDEYGTAAYKTVELDTFLNDKPVQHREVQGHESDLFKSYFDTIMIMKGGADTGFNRVKPEEYKPRLLQFNRVGRTVQLTEKALKRSSMTNGDVFVIDLGLTVYQWNGTDANKDEKYKAQSFIQELESERKGKVKSDVLDNQTVEHLHPKLENIIPVGTPKKDKGPKPPIEKVLNKLSDATGSLKFTEVARGSAVKKSALDPKDVFILETDGHCFVWCGSEASVDERRRSMEFAHKYLMKSDNPFSPITCVIEGKEPDNFHKAF
ncbi:gelsolin-like protein 1 isoform X2 [Actinia tenebrosa]|uniref:Gelsolin-like protein 1 isoform X2 n=1 Tax=Actinia tenebrosa TaxID=6105 RepID=A0A6P8IA30_ACTTE|nr:gelsolin-like protein 1 isoform X2 [Actinia tenebrosa]